MQAGELRHRIEIQRQEERTEDGFTEILYQPLKRVWAKANGLYGSEKWERDAYEAERTAMFTIRCIACPDLTVKDRIFFRGKLYDIIHIDNVLFGDNFFKITATVVEEGATDG